MSRTPSRCFIAVASLLLAAMPAHAAPADDAAIRAIEARQEAAWNAHDAHGYAGLFAADADVVDASGRWWKGRAEAETALATLFAGADGTGTLRIDAVSVRPLSDELALAHVTWSRAGARGPQQGIQTQLLRRIAGTWLIQSFQDTALTPAFSSPARPAAEAAAPKEERYGGPRPCLVGTRNGGCLIHKGAAPASR